MIYSFAWVVVFFPQRDSIWGHVELCSIDRSGNNYEHLYRSPFNLNFPGHQSPWEIQHMCFKSGCSFSSVASFYFISSRSTFRLQLLPLDVGDDGGEAQSTVFGLGLLSWAWGRLYWDEKQEFSS